MATKKTAKKAVRAIKKAVAATTKQRAARARDPSAPPKKPVGGTAAAHAQRRAVFVEAYLANGENATQAGIAAGLSARTAYSSAQRMLRYPDVQAAIVKRKAELLEKHKLKAEDVIASLNRALKFDPRKLYDEDGNIKPIHELDDDTALALSSIEVLEEFQGWGNTRKLTGHVRKFKAVDQTAARDQAMKHFGLYKVDNAQKVDPITALLDAIQGHGNGLPIKK